MNNLGYKVKKDDLADIMDQMKLSSSVVDPHHVDADPHPDPDPWIGFG